jgi:hypothetical protein
MIIGIRTLARLRVVLPFFALALLCVNAAAAEQLGGYTNMTRDSAHGTQVEYVATNGKTYLWYPGNKVILPGRWKQQGSNICFMYGANTYNPATGSRGAEWECAPSRLYWGGIVERMEGDPLGLQRRKEVPFKLDRARTTLEKLLARVSPRTAAPTLEVPAITSDGQVALSCKSIIANAERSKDSMAMAASTYFHGNFMGKPCVAVDYARAFELTKRAGMSTKPFLRILRERASTGNPGAIAALQLLDR